MKQTQPEIKQLYEIPPTVAEEDAEEQGETDLERELEYAQRLIDRIANALTTDTTAILSNMEAMMERVNELTKDNTVLRDKAAAAEKERAELREKCRSMEEYLAHGPLWRLFHSFESFYRKENKE